MADADTAPVLIVGSGWAGLAAAVRLTRDGHAVTLLESARQPGGRARRMAIPAADGSRHSVDNGQHLLTGACHGILDLLAVIGVDAREKILRQPLRLRLHNLRGKGLKLKTPALPAPLHLLAALLGATGLSAKERLADLRLGRCLSRPEQPGSDISVATLLQQQDQPRRLREMLWEPLCLAIMNTPAHEASAGIFLRVLRDVFVHRRKDSDLLFARTDLGSLFPDPAIDYLERRGGHLHLGMRVSRLQIEKGEIQGVYVDETFIPARQLVLATPIHATRELIREHGELTSLHQRLSGFRFEPVTTVYLQYPPTVRLSSPMQGIIGGQAQWLFDRRHSGQPGLMAVVISSRGPHLQIPRDQLGEQIAAELARLFPRWPAPLSRYVIREKRATFSSHTGIDELRPDNRTGVAGLWLAGDYTAQGYPATLEGAVRSGVQCARLIHNEYHQSELPC